MLTLLDKKGINSVQFVSSKKCFDWGGQGAMLCCGCACGSIRRTKKPLIEWTNTVFYTQYFYNSFIENSNTSQLSLYSLNFLHIGFTFFLFSLLFKFYLLVADKLEKKNAAIEKLPDSYRSGIKGFHGLPFKSSQYFTVVCRLSVLEYFLKQQNQHQITLDPIYKIYH